MSTAESVYEVNARAPSPSTSSSPTKHVVFVFAGPAGAIAYLPASGVAATVASVADDIIGASEVPMPSKERLRELAAANPPPQRWLEGPEEDLF
jgi:hypothetical protein